MHNNWLSAAVVVMLDHRIIAPGQLKRLAAAAALQDNPVPNGNLRMDSYAYHFYQLRRMVCNIDAKECLLHEASVTASHLSCSGAGNPPLSEQLDVDVVLRSRSV